MKKNLYLKYSLLLLLAAVLITSCGKDAAPVLYDEYANSGTPTPVVNSISPSDSAWGGYDTLTISGSNFSPVAENNLVWFDNIETHAFASTPTQIKVIAPHYPKDSVKIRVDVTTAHEYTQITKPYRIKPVQVTAWNLTMGEVPYVIALDKDQNIYSFIKASGIGAGIQKENVNKTVTQYLPQVSGYDWKAFKMGPGGVLYATRSVTAIWQIPETQKVPSPWVTKTQGITANILDLDFDAQGNMWAGGVSNSLFRVTQAKAVTKFAITADSVRSIRIFNNYVYVAGKKDSVEKVWRYQISGEQLGQEETYFDFTSKYPKASIRAITFAVDGTMYVGSNSLTSPIIMVSPSGAVSDLLPGVIKGYVTYFAANGTYLYYSREITSSKDSDQKIFRVNTFKQMAPYYGTSF